MATTVPLPWVIDLASVAPTSASEHVALTDKLVDHAYAALAGVISRKDDRGPGHNLIRDYADSVINELHRFLSDFLVTHTEKTVEANVDEDHSCSTESADVLFRIESESYTNLTPEQVETLWLDLRLGGTAAYLEYDMSHIDIDEVATVMLVMRADVEAFIVELLRTLSNCLIDEADLAAPERTTP